MNQKGFTLVELIISIAIFAFMTALLMAKYGNFNQSVLLTNLAYDVAVSIRTAQTYGLSVKGAQDPCGGSNFQCSYGMHFDTENGSYFRAYTIYPTEGSINTSAYAAGGVPVTDYNLKRGAVISNVCVSPNDHANCTLGPGTLDVVFRRPDPDALICLGGNCEPGKVYAEIEIKGTDGSVRIVSVRANGQISIKD